MTFLDAAYEVLKQAGQPLHYADITARALAAGLLDPRGQTPDATMGSRLYVDIKRPDSRFRKVGRGVFGLAEWQPEADTITAPPAALVPPPEPAKSYLSYKEAALQVLQEAGQPLHYQEIARQAIEQELINPQGLTPDATMGAQLYSNLKRRGSESPFRREGRGTFALAEWEEGTRGIVRQAARQRREVKRRLLETLRGIEPGEFEQLVGRLLGAMGYENIQVTRHNSDGGVDVLAEIEVGVLRLRAAVQVKRRKGNVQRPVVSQLRGDMAQWDVDQGMIITTGSFSDGAKQVARLRNVTPISLIDGDRVTDLLIEHGVGVRRETVEVVTFAPERLGEEE
ncbi:MAG: restriction endonuclease [Chloroflexi bacterium]|nr:restriction endonuclease [Chloroflexota bacterium]MBU1748969.1 restriction endonuclease [Chloroflexota bacterium]